MSIHFRVRFKRYGIFVALVMDRLLHNNSAIRLKPILPCCGMLALGWRYLSML